VLGSQEPGMPISFFLREIATLTVVGTDEPGTWFKFSLPVAGGYNTRHPQTVMTTGSSTKFSILAERSATLRPRRSTFILAGNFEKAPSVLTLR